MYLNVINDLRNLSNLPAPANRIFIVGGFYVPGDDGGGTFVWTPHPSPPADDTGIVIRITNVLNPFINQGYFKRVFSGPINVRWFGAITTLPDGTVQNTDVTLYVHAARDSSAFANNGTLYFPVGVYPGSFLFDYLNDADRNEINLLGDGHGSLLTSNGETYSSGRPKPVLTLGWRYPSWMWARVSNIKIDGSFGSTTRWTNGVTYANPSDPGTDNNSGRWTFERVTFMNCDIGVFKPSGNIGNHYTDCFWRLNNYGVVANGFKTEDNHNGCDRYSGGALEHNSEAAIYYDGDTEGGQIIIDGTVLEYNDKDAIRIRNSGDAPMLMPAICVRNVWFEGNGNEGGVDINLEGIRSLRVDDSNVNHVKLRASSMNMFNCRHNTGFAEGYSDWLYDIDDKSSLVAYEHRYPSYPNDKIFVNSISYDGSPQITTSEPTSVWGPLRVVTSTKPVFTVSEQFDVVTEQFDDFYSNVPVTNTWVVPQMRILGKGSGYLQMDKNWYIKSHNIIGTIDNREPKYCVWSIHTYLESDTPVDKVFGQILTDDAGNKLGNVYFKSKNWACSYGMKQIQINSEPLQLRLAFKTLGYEAKFYITDYQIVMFDDLASANSFVNSRTFAIRASGSHDEQLTFDETVTVIEGS